MIDLHARPRADDLDDERADDDGMAPSRGALARAHDSPQEAEAGFAFLAEFSRCLAVMGHKLRTPLNAIGGYAELLEMGLKGPVTPAQMKDLGRIRGAQERLVEIGRASCRERV